MYKLFIDDERYPATDDFVIVRSSSEAIEYVRTHGIPTYVSFDHDLGGDDTSRIFVNLLIDHLMDNKLLLPKGFNFYVHSQNPIGRDWIQGTMRSVKDIFGSD